MSPRMRMYAANMRAYTYIHTYMHTYIYIYIYIYHTSMLQNVNNVTREPEQCCVCVVLYAMLFVRATNLRLSLCCPCATKFHQTKAWSSASPLKWIVLHNARMCNHPLLAATWLLINVNHHWVLVSSGANCPCGNSWNIFNHKNVQACMQKMISLQSRSRNLWISALAI